MVAARTRRRTLDAESRRELIAVATRHFATDGYERASLNRIIAEAGLGKSSYYYYFDDKRELLLETLRDAVAELYRAVPYPEPPRSRQAFWPALEAHMRKMVRVLQKRPDLVGLFTSIRLDQMNDSFFDPLRAEARELYLPLLRAGRKLGCVRADAPLEVVASAWEAADAALDRSVVGKKLTPALLETHSKLAFGMFRRMFEAAPAGRRRARG